jgi:hypothetical protein
MAFAWVPAMPPGPGPGPGPGPAGPPGFTLILGEAADRPDRPERRDRPDRPVGTDRR